jgi:hypothetical protein
MKQEGLETTAALLTLAAMQGMKREESTAAAANAQVVADAIVRLYEHIFIRLLNSKTV